MHDRFDPEAEQLSTSTGAYWALALLVSFAISAWGFGLADHLQQPLYPATARVLVDGNYARGAEVSLHALNGSNSRPTGKVLADGTVQFTTGGLLRGAPAGEYAVAIRWNKPEIAGEDYLPGPNVLATRYVNPMTTPLRLRVSPYEQSVMTFELSSCDCAGR